MKRVFLRADASNPIGAGHLMRSSAIAQSLACEKLEVCFLTATTDAKLRAYLTKQPFTVRFFDLAEGERGGKKDLECTLEAARGSDWLVLDNDYFGFDFQNRIREAGISLAVIDDRCERRFDADLVVNPTLHAPQLPYEKSAGTTFLLGAPNVRLWKEILNFKKRAAKGLRHHLVTMGGRVQTEACAKVMQAVDQLKDFDLEVKVVGGFAERHSDSKPVGTKQKVERLDASFQMASLYDWADLAVCAGGGTCFELCYFGVVGVMGALEPHQLPVAESLDRAGIFKSIGSFEEAPIETIATALRELVENSKKTDAMRQKAASMIDGKGAARVFQTMERVR